MNAPISFVCWKWHQPGSEREFLAEHVNVLYAMVTRWYPLPFRFICITDERVGLDPRIEYMPMLFRFDDIPSPQGQRFPSCYCRLWNFSRDATCLGERILQLDIDVVITGPLWPLVSRPGEDFVGWSDKRFQKNKIAGGAYLLRTGALPYVWEDFDPKVSPARAFAAGHFGSDQGWMSYRIKQQKKAIGNKQQATAGENGNGQQTIGKWTMADGLTKINWTPLGARCAPKDARIVFTNGAKPPWSAQTQRDYPWVKDHWKL